jgi:hypothetical protein
VHKLVSNAVVEQLTDEERTHLSVFIDTAAQETWRTVQQFLLDTTTNVSVRFLPEHL